MKLILCIVLLLGLLFGINGQVVGRSGGSISSGIMVQADSIEQKAYALYFANNDSSIFLYTQAYKLHINDGDKIGQMRCLSRLSNLYHNQGSIDTAIILAYQSIEIGELNHYDTLLAETYLRMGNYLQSISKFNKARAFYLKTIVLDFPSTKNSAQAAIGQAFLKQGQLDSAQYYLYLVLDYFENLDSVDNSNLYNRASLLGSLGVIAFQLNDFNLGFDHLKESLRLSKKIRNSTNVIKCLINISIGYDLLEKPDIAIESLNEALTIADSLDYNSSRLQIYTVFTEHYEDIEEYKEAFYWTTRYHALQDSLDRDDYNKTIYENELKYQHQIQKVNQQRIIAEQKQSQLITTLSFSLVLLLFIIVSILLFRRLRRSIGDRKKHEAQVVSVEKELLFAKKRLEELNLILLKRNTRISDIHNASQSVEASSGDESLKELASFSILSKEDWVQYLEVFEMLYPRFISGIMEKYPNLTEGDKRQLIMLKLAYPRKKAASILGISPESVKKGRQRLSKKLGLMDVTLLLDFIKEF